MARLICVCARTCVYEYMLFVDLISINRMEQVHFGNLFFVGPIFSNS